MNLKTYNSSIEQIQSSGLWVTTLESAGWIRLQT